MTQFIAKTEKKEYVFNSGSKVYIFDCGEENNIPESELEDFVEFVHEVWLKDSGDMSLGRIADHIASQWPQIKIKSRSEILDEILDEIY